MALDTIGLFFTHLFNQVWRVLDLELPVFGVSIWRFWVGAFCITLSVRLISVFLWDESYKSAFGHYRYRRKEE